MLPTPTHLLLEQAGDTLTIWFNRPEARNALSSEMADELAMVFEALSSPLPTETPIRFVILRGKGGVFCSGGDLKMFRTVFQTGMPRDDIVAFNAQFGRLLAAIRQLPQLFVVAIEGAAMAGGLGIACLADVVIASSGARFALSEVTLGIPPAQITPVVIERIGASEARRLLLTAQRFDASEALRLGFIHFLEPDLEAMDARILAVLCDARRGAPGAIALTKQIIAACDENDAQTMVQFAAERFADAMLGDEAREGMQAFAEKRATAWSSNTGQPHGVSS